MFPSRLADAPCYSPELIAYLCPAGVRVPDLLSLSLHTDERPGLTRRQFAWYYLTLAPPARAGVRLGIGNELKRVTFNSENPYKLAVWRKCWQSGRSCNRRNKVAISSLETIELRYEICWRTR
jgi:hypothetical protein